MNREGIFPTEESEDSRRFFGTPRSPGPYGRRQARCDAVQQPRILHQAVEPEDISRISGLCPLFNPAG